MDNIPLEQLVDAVVRAVVRAMEADGTLSGSDEVSATLSAAPPPPQGQPAPNPGPPETKPEPASADVLAMFTGSYHPIEEAAAGLRSVTGSGYTVAGMLSRGGQHVLADRATPEGLGVSKILPYNYPENWTDFFSTFKVIALPTLTRTTAAKLVWGICDTLVSQGVYTSLALNIPVIAVTDGMSGENQCPECANFMPYVWDLNADYLKRLEKLGLRLVRAEGLGDEVLRYLRGARTPGPAYRGVITHEDVESVTGGEIVIVEGSILTALAQDHLRDHGVSIRYVPPSNGG